MTASFTQVPLVDFNALDDYATELLHDAMPEVLVAPCPVDIAWFLEFYLGLEVIYRRLSYDRQILGMTAFSPGFVQVLDDVTGQPMPMRINTGTVIVDPLLMIKRNIHRHRFTYAHEGSHWLIHRRAYSASNPFGTASKYENQYLAAKEGRIDYSRCQKERTENERMERQADFLASAILIPKPMLRMAYREFFRLSGDKPRRVVRGVNALDDCYAKQLPMYISQTFNVSKRAALIRLEKLGAIVDCHRFGYFA